MQHCTYTPALISTSRDQMQDFEEGRYVQTNLPFRDPPESRQHPLTDVLQRERGKCDDGREAAVLWAAASGIVDR